MPWPYMYSANGRAKPVMLGHHRKQSIQRRPIDIVEPVGAFPFFIQENDLCGEVSLCLKEELY